MPLNSLFDFDPLPDAETHAKLMDPEWQGTFRFCVHMAYDQVRKVLICLRVKSADPFEKTAFAVASLQRLREFLVESTRDARPCSFYAGPPEPKEAYESVCRMLADTKERFDTGQNANPIISLAYAHALLNGEDPARLLRDAEELSKAVLPPAPTEKTARPADPAARDEALRATIEAVDDGKSDKAPELIRLIGESEGWRVATKELLRLLYMTGAQDRRGLDRVWRTGTRLISRTEKRLDDLKTPLRIVWSPSVTRLIFHDPGRGL